MSFDSKLVGWREWAALPELGIPAVKAKVDTGARTSSLHAVNIERSVVDGVNMVNFSVHPLQRNNTLIVRTQAPLVDIRSVSDSGGHSENRFVISTQIVMGSMKEEIEITLTERSTMLFRMLVGRTALAGNVVVDPAASYLCGRKSTRLLYSSMLEAKT